MPSENSIAISTEIYQQLIRAKQDGDLLKAFIANAYEKYETIDRNTLKVLYTMFIGEKEEEE